MKVFVLESEADGGVVGVFSSHSSLAKQVISAFAGTYGDWAEEAIFNIQKAVDTGDFIPLMEDYGYFVIEFEVV